MKGKILKIKCDPKGKMETMPWKALKSMQGDFKTLDDEGRQTLRASMEKVGFKAPFFVWYGHDELLDGVQRTDVLEDMVSDGWTIPDKLPVVLIEAKSRQEALEDIARFSSQHGVVTEQGAINLFGIEGLKVILPVTRILNINIPEIILLASDEFGDTFSLPDGDKEPFQQMTFTLHDSQVEIVKEALKNVNGHKKSDVNENSNGNALAHICEVFLEQG